jgi:hypothetical protein
MRIRTDVVEQAASQAVLVAFVAQHHSSAISQPRSAILVLPDV